MKRDMIGRGGNVGPPGDAEEGFTLVELMVVVLIIGILVSIAIPVFNSMTEKARLRTCLANQRTIQGAASMWRVDSTTPVSTLAGVLNVSKPADEPAVPPEAAAVSFGAELCGPQQPDRRRGRLLARRERERAALCSRQPGARGSVGGRTSDMMLRRD